MNPTDLLFLSIPAALAALKLVALILAVAWAVSGLFAPRGLFFGAASVAGRGARAKVAGPQNAR